MPTITYNFEPTDEVYIIDYSEDLKAETVVKGTIYSVDTVTRTKAVVGVPEIPQVPSDAQIAASQHLADAALISLNAAITDRDTKLVVANTDAVTQATEEATLATLETTVTTEQATLTTLEGTVVTDTAARDAAQTALDADPGNAVLIAARDAAQVTLDASIAARDAQQIAVNDAIAARDAQQIVVNDATTAATTSASELATAEALVVSSQATYDGHIADTVITTAGVPGVTAVDADTVIKYVLRTAYDQSVMITDENLIFADKTAAFDALELRTP